MSQMKDIHSGAITSDIDFPLLDVVMRGLDMDGMDWLADALSRRR